MADPREKGARGPSRSRAQARPGGSPPRPARAADPVRVAAFEVLRAVAEEDAYANLYLPGRLRAHALSGRDAAFATELTSGTLRRQGTYDAIIVACAKRPLSGIDPAVLDVLRLGAHQLLAMRVASHAAVTTSVDLVRAEVGHGPAGFVNAVLRRVGEASLGDWVRRVSPSPEEDPIGFLVVSQSHPRWVVAELQAALGTAASEIDALLAADNEPPRVTLVARPGLSTRDELLSHGNEPTEFSPWGIVLAGGDPGAVAAVADGRAAVQDEGSQLVAQAFLSAAVAGRDDRWLDLCSGPGGKAALLGAIAAPRGVHLVAAERQPHRAKLVSRAVSAIKPGVVEVVVADGTDPPWPAASFDRVLVDAPCSGLGALRRRPESRWRRTPEDVTALVVLQQALLRSALNLVRPGGVVAYVTCSPVLAETRGVVEAILGERSDVVVEDAGHLLQQVPEATGPLPGTIQLWPHRHGTDAMFLALLRRAGTETVL